MAVRRLKLPYLRRFIRRAIEHARQLAAASKRSRDSSPKRGEEDLRPKSDAPGETKLPLPCECSIAKLTQYRAGSFFDAPRPCTYNRLISWD